MATNLILITSIIHAPNLPLSYISTRSVFTPRERFEQTKRTILSIREKIPKSQIIIVECSDLTHEENEYLTTNSDYFINLIDNIEAKNNIYSMSKSLGEGTMTMFAMDYINKNNIYFDNFFKITGRYWLSDNFNYGNFDNNKIIVHYINNNSNNVSTSLYKLYKNDVNNFYIFLQSNVHSMIRCVGYEILFAQFLKTVDSEKVHNMYKIGVNGYISVSNDFIDD